MILQVTPFLAAILAAIATLGLTPLVQQFGLRWGWLDLPGKRKVHQSPIVRVGGIAIITGTILPGLLLASRVLDSSPDLRWQMTGIVLGSIGFFLIGLFDDIFHVSPFVRLFLQGLVACVCWFYGVRIEVLWIPFVGVVSTGLLSLPITFLWLAGVANAINWMDGLDGLAGGVSAIAALILGLVCWHNSPLALIAFALAGSLAGFLRLNIHPARIFMGDGGSYFIGFLLAAIGAVGLMQSSPDPAPSLPFWILAVPLGDMMRVIVSRLWGKKSPFFPDQQHLHHKLLSANLSVPETARLIWCFTAWLGSWVMLAAAIPLSAIVLLLTSVGLIVISRPLWEHRLLASSQCR